MLTRYRLILYTSLLLFSLLSVFIGQKADAQTLPVGDLREDQLRLQQLLNDSLTTSFVQRPVWADLYNTYMDAAEGKPGWWNRRLTFLEEEAGAFFRAGIYEPSVQATVNSGFPMGENNAAAWYGKGLTNEFFGGFYITSDFLTISVRPHLIYHQNRDFLYPRFIPVDSDGETRYLPEGMRSRIDMPFRFGPDPYWTADPGHSSIRLHFRQLETGVSTEPLWWGGALHYPLTMSNNAPGVKHLFLGTRSPINIPYVGSLEFRWILGWPEDSVWFDAPESVSYQRFINFAHITFSPEVIPGLYLGATRNYMMHVPDGVNREHIRVIFEPLRKESLADGEDVSGVQSPLDQAASVYFRWLFPRANAEIFGEYIREDHSWDFRDFMMQPHHSSGYSFGFQKIFFPPVSQIDFLKAHLEVTSLNPSRLDEIRWQSWMYTHGRIRQGHTNRGQVLGAAIGPGSSQFRFGLDGYKDDFKVGLFFQRLADNEHLHYRWYLDNAPQPWGDGDRFNHRVNLSLGANVFWGPGPYYLYGNLIWTRLFNYGRFNYGNIDGWDWDDRVRDDETNIQLQLGVRYAF